MQRVYCYEIGRQKNLYRSQKSAEMALKFINPSDFPEGHVPIRAYKCTCCDGWHLTSQEETGQENKVRTKQVEIEKTDCRVQGILRKIEEDSYIKKLPLDVLKMPQKNMIEYFASEGFEPRKCRRLACLARTYWNRHKYSRV